MTVEAYRYAQGAPDDDDILPPPPPELALLAYIDRFGVRAILGRDVLRANEVLSMMIAENVVKAYLSRKASENWGKWASENPRYDDLLKSIEVDLE